MKKILAVMFVAAMTMLAIGTASADSSIFTNPPETYAPEWQGPNPYGRNIFWDFSTNPVLSVDQVYFGLDDTALKALDSVSKTGNLTLVSGEYGAGSGKSGTVSFHINNYAGNMNYNQYLWVEFNTIISGTGSYVSPALTLSSGSPINSSTSWGAGNITTTGLYDMWFKLKPFPTYETLTFTLNGVSGGSARIDNVHFAATPEPVSTVLFLLGGTIVAGRVYFRKKLKKS